MFKKISLYFLIYLILLGAIDVLALAQQQPIKKSDIVMVTPNANPAVEAVVQLALKLELDQSPQWLNLLNYRRDFFFWKRSQADSPAFFFAADGKSNPRSELVATIRAIFKSSLASATLGEGGSESSDKAASCLFPGRFLWLQRSLPEVAWPQLKCVRFENYKNILSAHSATYVFSSYYMNNPSSAFGHSFLRLNRSDESHGEKKFELIDFGVGYAAVPTTANPILYSFMGVAGFFQGRFETRPYYYKVREYNDFESRDLWEYDLNLSQSEVNLLVAHIFELDNAGFDYLYFTENCAYRILAALDAVRPELKLVEQTKLDVIPGDSVDLVAHTPGLVKAVHYRPSNRAIFTARMNTLEPLERSEIETFIQDENVDGLIQGKSEIKKQHLLDAVMDYIDFQFADDVLKEKGRFKLKKQVLLKRSEVVATSVSLVVPPPPREAPDTAHGSARFYLGSAYKNDTKYLSYGLRMALHDLLDPVTGYPANSDIGMGNFEFTTDLDHSKTELQEFSLVEIVSLAPTTEYSRSLSWRLKFSANRLYPESCNDCLPIVFEGGVGLAKNFIENLTTSLWLRAAAAYSSDFYGDKYIIGAGPALLVRYFYSDRFSFLAEARYRYDYKAALQDYREATIGAQWNLQKNLGLRAGWHANNEYNLNLNYYY